MSVSAFFFQPLRQSSHAPVKIHSVGIPLEVSHQWSVQSPLALQTLLMPAAPPI